jgi:hypothetical protein
LPRARTGSRRVSRDHEWITGGGTALGSGLEDHRETSGELEESNFGAFIMFGGPRRPLQKLNPVVSSNTDTLTAEPRSRFDPCRPSSRDNLHGLYISLLL